MAVIPFLWIIPLALYLLTFIIAFDQPKLFVPIAWALLVAAALYALTMVDRRHAGTATNLYDWGTFGASIHWIVEGLIHQKRGKEFTNAASPQVVISFAWYVIFCFATMFGICMLCHGELFRLRPQPRYLTGYYLMIAAGGALGGLLVAIVAPLIFVTYVEWSASVFLGFLLATGIFMRSIWRILSDKRVVAAPENLLWTVPAFVAPLALLLIGAFDLAAHLGKTDEDVVLRERNFFGALHIEDNEPRDSEQHNLTLVHGRITHGMQFTDEERRHIPTTYYARDSGVGRTVGFYRQVLKGRGVRIGCIGLGTGTMAAYVDRGDSIRFYDINPAVIEISTTGKWFTYFTDARQRGGKSDVVLGDARLSLERECDDGRLQHFDVLVLDAFSGDAIPVHLLTREAFEIYRKHLANAEDGQDGAIAVHITNRYLDLEPVVLGLAEEFKLGHVFVNNSGDSEGGYNSDWIIVTRNAELLHELKQYAQAEPEDRDPPEQPKKPLLWTDDFSNLFDVLK